MKTKTISYDTLKDEFYSIFGQPRITEIAVEFIDNGWILEFAKGSFYWRCKVMKKDLIKEIKDRLDGKDLDSETVNRAIKQFEDYFVKDCIPAKDRGGK